VSEEQASAPGGPSSGTLAAQAMVQFGGLVGQEIALARAELRAQGRHFGMGAALLGTAGFLGFTAWLVLVGAAIAGIAVALPGWAAALIVGGSLALAAGGAAALGGRRFSRVSPPLPQTVESIRRDLREIREKASR
jgi:hypothetical protein